LTSEGLAVGRFRKPASWAGTVKSTSLEVGLGDPCVECLGGSGVVLERGVVSGLTTASPGRGQRHGSHHVGQLGR